MKYKFILIYVNFFVRMKKKIKSLPTTKIITKLG